MENNLGVPRCGIVARDDNGVPLLDKRRHRVVPQVSHQSQDLVGDGTDLQGDVPLPVWVSQHVSKFVVYILNIIFRGLKSQFEKEMGCVPGYPHGLRVLCDGVPVADPLRTQLVIEIRLQVS